jgi:hypothetical protein
MVLATFLFLRRAILLFAIALVTFFAASCDCGWRASSKVWLDENGNGLHDPAERPLENIWLRAVSASGWTDPRAWITDRNGEAALEIFPTDCDATYQVYPELPSGYRLTTPERQPAKNGRAEPLQFGLAYAPSFEPTPRPTVSISCTTYVIGESSYSNRISDIQLAPDGSIWATAEDAGYVRVAPDDPPANLTPIPVPGLSGASDRSVKAIAVTQDGDAWFAVDQGVSRLHGSTWITYTQQALGLPSAVVEDIAVQPDGSAWFLTRHGVLHYDPVLGESDVITNTNGWFLVPIVNQTADGTVWAVQHNTDDSLWFMRRKMADLSSGEDSSPVTQVVTAPLLFRAGDVGKDLSWWFVAQGPPPGLAHLEPATGSWTIYTSQSTNGALIADRLQVVATAPDGSVYVGTSQSGVVHFSPGANTWQLLTTDDGLPSDYITGIVAEAADAFWVSACNPQAGPCAYDSYGDLAKGSANLLAHCRVGG